MTPLSSPLTMKGVGELHLVRRTVLFLVGFAYFSAFGSLHYQFPGLLSKSGVLPSTSFCHGWWEEEEENGMEPWREDLRSPNTRLAPRTLGVSVDSAASGFASEARPCRRLRWGSPFSRVGALMFGPRSSSSTSACSTLDRPFCLSSGTSFCWRLASCASFSPQLSVPPRGIRPIRSSFGSFVSACLS